MMRCRRSEHARCSAARCWRSPDRGRRHTMASTETQPRIAFLEEPMRLYIDGVFVETDEGLPSLNPATGAQLAEAPLASAREVDAAVAAAGRAFEEWRVTPPAPPARPVWRRPRPPAAA